MSVFKPITNANELCALCKEDSNNVGVTRSGELYTFDFDRNKPEKITLEDAGLRLGLSLDIMAKVVKSGGTFEVPQPIVIEKKDVIDDEHENNESPGEKKEIINEDHENDEPPGEKKDEEHQEEVEKEVMKIQVELSEKFLKEFQEMFEALKTSLDESFKEIKQELQETKEELEKTKQEFDDFKKQILL